MPRHIVHVKLVKEQLMASVSSKASLQRQQLLEELNVAYRTGNASLTF
jgi:hypothetical protein